MARVVSFINYKGGVGKTTSAYHVSCSLAQHHRQRVLMIDIDPQTNLTFLCAEYDKWQRYKRNVGTIKNLYDRYNQGLSLDVQRFIWKESVAVGRNPILGLDLIPCDIDLLGEDLSGGGEVIGTFTSMEAIRQNAQHYMKAWSFLSKVIDDVRDRYDWIIIDCPPNLYLMTQNALHASDYYVITAIPDHLSTIGMSILTDKIQKIGALISPVQALAGLENRQVIAKLGAIVFVKVRSGGDMITITHQQTMDHISNEQFAAGKVVSEYTTELIGYSEAAENQIPVWAHNTENARRAAHQYRAITRELIPLLALSP